ncbi:MAG: transporter [Desulfococcaceae bacterium]
MKKRFWAVLYVLIFTAMAAGWAAGGETGHYVPGVEGIKAGSVPPPGFYYRMYNAYYTADTMTDADGDELNIDFDVTVYAMVNRFLWVSDYKILGGNYVADVLIPLIYTDVEIGAMGLEDDKFGLGDICIEPFLISWHGKSYDAVFGAGFFLPSGDYDADEPASPGKDHWGGIFTLGGTYYFDAKKTWSASVLSRYETHGEKDDTDVAPGDNFLFEWGIAKTVNKIWDLGITGYCAWQITDDKGDDVTWNKDDHDQAFAIGPEVSVFMPSYKMFMSLRGQQEFEVEDRSEGSMVTLTLTKIW